MQPPIAPEVPDKLQSVSSLLDRIEQALVDQGQIGLLTVTAVGTSDETVERWEDYERLLGEISTFLRAFSRNRLRRSDALLDPLVSGNTYVMMIGPPRDERTFDRTDVQFVRDRLDRELRHHLSEHLPPELIEAYGTYVGSSRITHAENVDIDRVVFHGIEAAQAEALGRRKLDAKQQAMNLRHLLATGGVRMVYQPLVDLEERRVIGYEALTRLPDGQFQAPEVVFKVAHEQGVLWALERLCRKRALETLPKLGGDQRLFLNVEPDSFYDPCLRGESFLSDLEHAGLDPSRVVLELTERAAVRDFVAMRKVLGDVRERGYPLALDDVGSGYAGLQTIAEIRPDYLKMDMALIRNLHLDPVRRELVRAVRDFADSTRTTLIAEGVESIEELNTLTGAGVRHAQGFLFAKPRNPPEIPDWPSLGSRRNT